MHTIRNTEPLTVKPQYPRSSRRLRETRNLVGRSTAPSAPRDENPKPSGNGLFGVSVVQMINGPKLVLEAKRQERQAKRIAKERAAARFRKQPASPTVQQLERMVREA